jgi:hypothetical protein
MKVDQVLGIVYVVPEKTEEYKEYVRIASKVQLFFATAILAAAAIIVWSVQ